MIQTEKGTMIPVMSWEKYVDQIPLVAVMGLMSEWMTIYAVLQQAVKNFDHILICGDGVTPKTKFMLDKFLHDHKEEANKIHFIELGDVDPWPWVVMTRPGVKYESVSDIPVKSPAKATFKRFKYASAAFPNSILCSLHSDIIVFDDTGKRIKERMKNIKDPFFESEWYSMITMHDTQNICSILSEDSSPGNLKGHPALRQRTTYDYPGDWGLMSMYGSSLLSAGPDPGGHETECLYPWSRKTQCEKKGCDTSPPHAIHFEWIKDRCLNKDFSSTSWKIVKRNWLEENDIELFNRIKSIDDLYFPVEFRLDENFILRIKEMEIFDQ